MNALHARRFTRPAWATVAAAIALGSTIPTLAQSLDRVRLVTGVELQGEVSEASPNGIDLEGKNGPQKISIESIREVRFANEPEELRSARTLLLRKDGAGALDELAKIKSADLEGIEKEIQTELAFVRAAATGRKALASGEGLAAGQKAVADFLTTYPRSHHFYDMQELLGDVFARQGKIAEAAAAYGTLDKGPPAIEVRAATLKADLLSGQQKYPEALREYEAAAKVATKIEGDSGKRARLGADMGRARCLTRLGKAADAIAAAQGMLKDADSGDSENLARLYALLGEAQRTLGDKDRDAIVSFLTVDMVHNSVPEEHAQALFNLVELWEKTNNPERAREARQNLETSYPDSPWTKKLRAAKAS
ncbi:MAG: tetratricopeptide repeat protein [Planctomycetia bacterium]|nr:tetratricopeptide repeat protein [Planctomycetia bacterium]